MAGHLSHGRGGAGNMGRNSPAAVDVDTLVTPTIKKPIYSSGRGGQGNMQPNVHPDITRQTQDVDAPPRSARTIESGFQYGRGGAGNTVIPSKEEIVTLRDQERQREVAEANAAAQMAKGKGKEPMYEKPKREEKKEQKTVVGKSVDKLTRVMSKGQ